MRQILPLLFLLAAPVSADDVLPTPKDIIFRYEQEILPLPPLPPLLVAAMMAAEDPSDAAIFGAPIVTVGAAIGMGLPATGPNGPAAVALIGETLDRDQILTLYGNRVYLGLGCHGFPAAAPAYFGRPVGALTLAETAYLAGLARLPTAYDPLRFPEKAVERRNAVLDAMGRARTVSASEAAAAAAAPLTHQVPLGDCKP